jgi:transcriptional regulator with XRE-family HTH domain
MKCDRHKLRKLRQLRGLSRTRLARALGVSRQTVNYWETGRNGPDEANMAKLAQMLGVQMEDLITEDESNVA